MIRILNRYFANQQYIQSKSVYGLLKHYRSPLNNYVFTDDPSVDCIILLHIETVTPDLDNETYNELLRCYKQNPRNKILIDTTLEDFLNSNFFDITKKLEEYGIAREDIFVLTGQNNVPIFQHDFLIPYVTFNINLFELSYYYFVHENNLHKEVFKPIKPRKLTRHVCSFIKNPRKVRRLLHAYYCLNGYDQYMLNSWHHTKAFNDSDRKDLAELGVISNDISDEKWKKIVTSLEELVQYNDDVEGNGEWIYQPGVKECGLVFTNETHHSFEKRDFLQRHINLDIDINYDFQLLKEAPIFYRFFLTEKTYKNFAYGMPFLNLGIPGSAEMLGTYGYKSWENILDIPSSAATYYEGFNNAFEAMDKIFNMPLQELEDIVNSERSIDCLKHNRQKFLEQHEFRRLINVLEIITSTII